jgi:ribonuclease R
MASNKNDIADRISALLHRRTKAPLTATEIADELGVRGNARKSLQKTLNSLVVNGDIVCIRRNRYAIGQLADLITGILLVFRSGNGLVESPEGNVFIASHDQGTAFPGDRVLVRPRQPLQEGDDGRRAGKIIRILERKRHEISGTLRSTGRFLYVVPFDASYKHDIYVSEDGGAEVGDRVICRFIDWPNRHVNPEGEIIERLGSADDPSVDTISVIRQHNLDESFPSDVMREAERVVGLVDKPGRRLDLRDTYVITIDPERARDFDDALSLEKRPDGTRVLGIHIADVAHFVRPDSRLDHEARRRGNSVYLPDLVIPMLPEEISNGVCSLGPDEDRLAFSIFVTINPGGKALESGFARTRIRSRCRLTYKLAMAAIAGRRNNSVRAIPVQARRLLSDLHEIAQQLRKARFARFALDLDMPECEIVMGRKGVVKDIRLVENDVSHQLVEECMIVANESVARELSSRRIPLISRLHEPPAEERIESLTTELESLGYSPGDLMHPRNMSDFLTRVKDDPLVMYVRLSILKSLNRAVYAADNSGHYGLAKTHYAHFTSPIRRYPDLTVHRQLGHSLVQRSTKKSDAGSGRAKRFAYTRKELKPIADGCTATEQVADAAERSLSEIKKYRYLENQLKTQSIERYDAIVVSVVNFGLFVEIPALQLQGLVHVSELSDRFVHYNKTSQSLKVGKDTYRVGAKFRVLPVRVDFDKRQIDFSPVA